MTKIIRSAADFLYPFIMIYGFYIVIHGHLTPGGGFQGGAVLATGIILMVVANHYQDMAKKFKQIVFTLCETLGLVIFGLIGIGAIMQGKGFLYNWAANLGGLFGQTVEYGINGGQLNTGGLIPILNIAIGLEVLGALTMIIFYMISYASQTNKGSMEHNL